MGSMHSVFSCRHPEAAQRQGARQDRYYALVTTKSRLYSSICFTITATFRVTSPDSRLLRLFRLFQAKTGQERKAEKPGVDGTNRTTSVGQSDPTGVQDLNTPGVLWLRAWRDILAFENPR